MADAFGHGLVDKRLEILRLINEAGSISEAARMAGVRYKAAWQAIDTLSNLASAELIANTQRTPSARLSALGLRLVCGISCPASCKH